jgi:hypothetical protein
MKEALVREKKDAIRFARLVARMSNSSSEKTAVHSSRDYTDGTPISSPSNPSSSSSSAPTLPPEPHGSSSLSSEDFPRLRKNWLDEYSDLVGPIPETLPPYREVNHNIPLIDLEKKYRTHHPRCPDAYRDILREKVERYIRAGWWVPKQVSNTVPLLCIPKKNGGLRTAMDCRQRNDNTIKDVTPFPDQDTIRHDVARAAYRSKLDMSEAFEQIRIIAEHVDRTCFETPIFGTFVSNVIQQGDCNGPSTFQRLMTTIFRPFIGVFVHVYLDDIFIYSESIDDHQRHIRLVLDVLREQQLYLSKDKVDLFSDRMDCLGHIIDNQGIHADLDKCQRIFDWTTPRNYHDVQCFMGVVQYLAQFLPELTRWSTPFQVSVRNKREFRWTPIMETGFRRIKDLVRRTPVLKPINPKLDLPIWVICDASVSGIGAYYGQGETWETCRPAGFLSRKFNNAQRHYPTFEQEMIAILEALHKWEDKLIGNKLHIITDHRALEEFHRQPRLNSRQVRWSEYISRFDLKIEHVEGLRNKVADSLSRFYQSDNSDDIRDPSEYVDIDQRLDPLFEDVPDPSKIRVAATRILTEVEEERHQHARELDVPRSSAYDSVADGADLITTTFTSEELWESVRSTYKEDKSFQTIVQKVDQFPMYSMVDGLLYLTHPSGERVLCVPHEAKQKGRRVREILITDAHQTLGHMGKLRTAHYIKRYCWWPNLTKQVDAFCKSCGTCQTTKTSTVRPSGLLHSLPVPNFPWDSIGMDFIGPFRECEGFNYILVAIDRFSSMVHLIPTTTTVTALGVANLYVREIVRLHGLPKSIVSDRDSKFTSTFWKELHRILGTSLKKSTAFHPQTDGATERANRTIGQILRGIVNDEQSDWLPKLPLVEFAINSSINASTGFAPFEINYGRVPSMGLDILPPATYNGITEYAERAREIILEAHDNIISSRIEQSAQANKRRKIDTPYAEGDKVYLSTANLNLPPGRTRKLLPKYIGPYKVLKYNIRTSTATLDLPEELTKRRIHPHFHAEKLRPSNPNDEEMFPHRDASAFYDFGIDPDVEYPVHAIIAHRWVGKHKTPQFYVQWVSGDFTWEPTKHCDQLAALEEYLILRGVEKPEELPKDVVHE